MTLSERKEMQRAIRDMLSTYEFTHFITLATNKPMVKQRRMQGMLKAFDARLSRHVAGPKWKRHPIDDQPHMPAMTSKDSPARHRAELTLPAPYR